jgi:uncharacterized protein YjlB
MTRTAEVIHGHVTTDILQDDGQFPNNAKLPLLIYKGVLHLHPNDEPESVIELFKRNNWTNSWKDGIFHYHHYHSNAHEVLGIFCGKADVQLGGPEGVIAELVRGDVIVIPAGVAHKCIAASRDFLCVGAYYAGRDYDIKYGKPEERPQADENIARVPTPVEDPLLGEEGLLKTYWKS